MISYLVNIKKRIKALGEIGTFVNLKIFMTFSLAVACVGVEYQVPSGASIEFSWSQFAGGQENQYYVLMDGAANRWDPPWGTRASHRSTGGTWGPAPSYNQILASKTPGSTVYLKIVNTGTKARYRLFSYTLCTQILPVTADMPGGGFNIQPRAAGEVLFGFYFKDDTTLVAGPTNFDRILIDPLDVTISASATKGFQARAYLGQQASDPQPAINWSTSGGGTIDELGVFQSNGSNGTFVVTASSEGKTTTTTIAVDGVAVQPERPAYWVKPNANVQIVAQSIDQAGNILATPPTGVVFSLTSAGWAGGSISPSGLFAAGAATPVDGAYSPPMDVLLTWNGVPQPRRATITVINPALFPPDLPDSGADSPSGGQPPEGAPVSNDKNATDDPVMYGSGELVLHSSDIASEGFSSYGVTRSYANRRDGGAMGLGGRWVMDQLPSLTFLDTNIVANLSALSTRVFLRSAPGVYQPQRYELERLDLSNGMLVLTDGRGNRTLFYDVDYPVASLRGKPQAFIDPGQNVTRLEHDSAGQIQAAVRSILENGQLLAEEFRYSWDHGRIVSVRRIVTRGSASRTVRKVVYSYYTGAAGEFGESGSLRSATALNEVGISLERDYYRYWRSGEVYRDGSVVPTNAAGLLKYVVSPRSMARLVQASRDPMTTTVSDAQLEPYATKYFEYDAMGRVTLQSLRGEGVDAVGIYTFVYISSPRNPPQDYNLWRTKTVETLADGTQNIVYCNHASQVLATVRREAVAPNRQWIHAYRYDASGRELWHATPAAVTGVTESADDLGLTGAITANAPNVKDSEGLIGTRIFPTATTADATTPGTAAGFQAQERVQQGELGTPQVVSQSTYTKRDGN